MLDRNQYVHQWFESEASTHPNAPCLVADDASLSFGEVNAQSNRLAHHLRALGVGPESRVAVALERGAEMVICVLAILKAGGCYLPLDPSHPTERLRLMLAESDPRVVLTTGEARVASLSGAGHGTCVDVRAERGSWQAQPSTALRPADVGLSVRNLAYVLYTSGSTGRPKGVEIEHRSLSNLVAGQIEYLGLQRDARILQVSSFSFDASVSEIFMALCSGAALHLAPQGDLLVGDALAAVIARDAITHLTLTPTVLETLGQHSLLESLRTLIVAGEALSAPLARRWARARRLVNAYGPTEVAVCATMYDCREDSETAPPIGRPLPNVLVYVLDPGGRRVATGDTGEIFIGGVGVARGYLARPELTEERFVPDPFSDQPGARMFKSGDLGRCLPDGSVEFCGRDDDQVKVRGIRVELGEIESHLRAHADVESARVVLRQDAATPKRLVAYYVTRPHAASRAAALRDYVARRLPEYMVPAAFVHVPELPLTPNGKLDLNALPAPRESDLVTSSFEAPVGELETQVAGWWAELLGVKRVGRHDDFFALGGNSLEGLMLVARIRERLSLDVHIKQLFDFRVLARFAQSLRETAHITSPIRPSAEDQEAFVLSSAQKRLWFLAQMNGASHAYHIGIGPISWMKRSGLRLRGPLDHGALRAALDRLVARHESLRTTFATVDGAPSLRIAPEATAFELLEHDLRAHRAVPEELARIKMEESRSPFDLERGPLIRGRLVRIADDDHVLLMTTHHIVCDGWSGEVLMRELGLLYAEHRSGKGGTLAPFPLQYKEYTNWQRRWLTGEVLSRQTDYWRRQLQGAPASLNLPTDRPRPAKVDFAGDYVDVCIDEGVTTKLKELSERRGTTLYATLLAAWAVLLGRLAGQEDLVIGTPFAGRTRSDVEGLVGCFVNTIALRVDTSASPSVAAMIDRVAKQTLDAQQNQDLPFEQVVELVNPVRDPSRSPLFQVMFSWQNHALSETRLSEVSVSAEEMPDSTAKFDLELRITESEGRIVGVLAYATALFDRATVELHIDYFRALLRAMTADDQQSIAKIELLSDQEARSLVESSPVRRPAARECIHALFEAQVARTPTAVALVQDDRQLTYRELNGRANHLAAQLRRMGVGPDARVAICFERGVEMVVGILATLKAGGAYVPLDPSYPGDRLAHMLTDSAAVVALVHEQTLGVVEGLLGRSSVSIPLIELLSDAPAPADSPVLGVPPAEIGLTPDHLAYVIYTSGSTGTPKGVGLPHAALMNLIRWHLDTCEPRKTLQFAALSFDVSFQEIFSALCSGAAVVLADDETRQNPRKLFRLIRSKGVERLFLPYAALRAFAEAVGDDSTVDCGLREIIVAGEQLVITPAIARLFAGMKGCRLYNHYGPSETHVVTAFALPHDVAAWPPRPPIGRPVGEARIYILDRYGELALRGAVGELFIGGPVLGRGYLNQPALTEERFVQDPRARAPGARMYRTGDLARYRTDGEIEFLGRNDFQIKLRGFRVELGEIESRLAAHPAVRGCVVVARGETEESKRLVAYYVAERAVPTDELKAHLGRALPEYMVPTQYVQLPELPLTPSGKIDRGALPDLGSTTPAASEPAGEVAQHIAAMWAELLGVEGVEGDSNFFELGGHSLLATVLLVRIRSKFNVELEPEDVFKVPALNDFARLVVLKQLEQLGIDVDGADPSASREV